MMKKILILICTSFLFQDCNDNESKEDSCCPSEIVNKGYCEIYEEALWSFYSSNSHGNFTYRDSSTQKNVILEDLLSVELQLFSWRESNDTIEFILTSGRKYDLDMLEQKIRFNKFGFNKKTKKLIYRIPSNIKLNTLDRTNGYVFYKGDKTYNYLDSTYKSSSYLASDMRKYGLYPIDEQDSILINKIINRKNINECLIQYAKKKGLLNNR